MKKLIVIIASCIFFSNANAQSEGNKIQSTGFVGVGTLSPINRLTVDPHGKGGILVGTTGADSTFMIFELSAGKDGYGKIQAVKNSGTNYGDLALNFDGGNVGIGMGAAAPTTKLDVNGTIHSNGLNTEAGFELGPLKTGTALLPYIDFHYGPGIVEDYNVRIYNDANNTLSISSMSSANTIVRVAGNIITKKIKVTQTPWADFVFADDYKLPPLMEVENYIKSNKHLSEIPSAEEVKKNGIDVGEMNQKLLQKVEELTLYLIQQQKMIDEQNKRITQLECTVK